MGEPGRTPSVFSSVFICVHPWLKRVFLAAAPLLFGATSLAAAPEIEAHSPLALRPGTTTEVTFTGKDVGDAKQLWTSFPAQVEALGAGRFRLRTDAAVGIGAVRLHGSNGVSNLRLVALDDLPAIAASKTNQTRAAAQSVALGTAVDGRANELGYDWFQVRLKTGQRLSVEVLAARLGSKLDPVLRLLAANGRELARNDDAPGWSGDSYLSLTAPETGDYFLELRDVNYGGGEAFFYHLRLGDFPLATVAYPPVVAEGRRQAFEVLGPGGTVAQVMAAASNVASINLPAQGAMGTASARAMVVAGPATLEKEPNDTPGKAERMAVPGGVSGRFERARDRDWFEFEARAGQRLEFRAATRTLSSPCDAVLRLETAPGKKLAGSDPSAADEGVFSHTFESNGLHRLVISEAGGSAGPHLVYHVTISPAPDFALTLDTDRVNTTAGATFDLKVTAHRSGYKGAITLGLSGAAGQCALTNQVIAEGKTNVVMKVTVPRDFPPGLHTVAITGTARGKNQELRVPARITPALRRQFPQARQATVEFEDELVLHVAPRR